MLVFVSNNLSEAVKNGAEPDDMILHRAINHDRVDLIEYFCFSLELPKHCKINYTYELFGDDAQIFYACFSGAKKTIDFLLNDPRFSGLFNIEKNLNRAFYQACFQYQVEVIDLLLSKNQTKNLCKIDKEDFKIIKMLDKESRSYKIEPLRECFEYLIMNLDIHLVKEMESHIINHKEMAKPIFEARQLHEELNINNKKIKSIKM